MNKSQFRRQFWLVLLIVGVGYLWWQSTTPDRYAEFSYSDSPVVDLPIPGILSDSSSDNRLLQPSPVTLLYSDTLAETQALQITREMLGDSCLTTIKWWLGDSLVSACSAILESGYAPSRIELTRGSETFELVASDETLTTRRTSDPASSVTWPRHRGLLFEDLLLVQAPYWRGQSDSVSTRMAVFTDRAVPLGMVDVTICNRNDSTLELISEYGQTVRLGFSNDNTWVRTFESPNGRYLRLVEQSGGVE